MPKKTAQIIKGKILAEKILTVLKQQIRQMKRPPGLAAVLVGDDPASHLYVSTKKKACQKVGIDFRDYLCGGKDHPNETAEDVIKVIGYLNNNDTIDGIIVQLPLPQGFDTKTLIDKIDPAKDVDGFLPQNQKDLLSGQTIITSPLINAVNAAIASTGENLSGKTAVIVSKSPIFAEPMKKGLKKQGLKVETIKPDKNFSSQTKKADVLITIVGKPHLITKDMVKEGAIVIDIGTTLVGEKKWLGDVDPAVAEVAGFLTPVPGGIGPLTVAMLLKNTYDLAQENEKRKV